MESLAFVLVPNVVPTTTTTSSRQNIAAGAKTTTDFIVGISAGRSNIQSSLIFQQGRSYQTTSMYQTISSDDLSPPAVVERQSSTEENNNARYSQRSARGGGIIDLRYSKFLQMVQNNQIEKVTFSSTGNQLLGFSRDGMRIKLDALPNDPDLLTELADHKVDVTVLPEERALSLTENLVSLIFPLAIFAGLFFLARRRTRYVRWL
jgi:ATP-dependent Zn proteases